MLSHHLCWTYRKCSGFTVQPSSGFEINEKLQSQFCDRIPKFSRNLATFSRRIFALHFYVNGLAKLNMSPQYLRVKKPLKMANDRKSATVPVFTPCSKEVTSQLNYATIKVSSD